MKKLLILLLTIVLLVSITACTNSGTSSTLGNNSLNGSSSQSQGNNSPNGGSSPSQGNNSPNDSNSPNQGNRQPGADQQVDTYYSIDDLIELVKQAGCISGNPESLDVKAIGAVKGVAYGNVVFLDYELTDSQAFLDAYSANKVTVNGKDAKIGAINGPYVMAFFDHNVDQKAVKAFHSLGFGN